ncbi:MAG: LLM class flavin-dependent oxidoreductase [Actinomycetota bacterium]
MTTSAMPLSVLDLATVAEGATTGQALADTTSLARAAEELGYHRFWVAEHHNMASVASTVPSVLLAHLGAATSRIRLGSGGVMLPNHAPLAVAEQFAMLEALHPGRIDLGVGRAPGTDRATAVALRRTDDHREEEQFPRNLLDVMGLLGDVRSEEGLWDRFRATPAAAGGHTPVLLLGSSGFSAQLAGMLGLPFAFAHHFDMGGTTEATSLYRDHFEPSAVLDAPHTIVTASVIVADDATEADRLAAPARLRRYGLRRGRLLPLLPPEEASAHPEYPAAAAMGSGAILGTGADAVEGLTELAARTGADELMVNMATYGITERIHSLALLSRAWSERHQTVGIGGATAAS